MLHIQKSLYKDQTTAVHYNNLLCTLQKILKNKTKQKVILWHQSNKHMETAPEIFGKNSRLKILESSNYRSNSNTTLLPIINLMTITGNFPNLYYLNIYAIQSILKIWDITTVTAEVRMLVIVYKYINHITYILYYTLQ